MKQGVRLAIYSEANIVKNRYTNKCNVEEILGIFNLRQYNDIISESNADTENVKFVVNRIYSIRNSSVYA